MALESAIAFAIRKAGVAALKEEQEIAFSDLLKITTFSRLYAPDMGTT